MVATPMQSHETGFAAQGRRSHARTPVLPDRALGAWGRLDDAMADAMADQADAARLAAMPDASPAEHAALLAGAIEQEIVPRLVLTHIRPSPLPDAAAPAESACCPAIGGHDIAYLVGRTLANDMPGAIAVVESLHAQGIALERLYLDLLAPAARDLGDRWTDDTVDFTQVTAALLCLHQVLRAFSPAFQREAGRGANGRRALLAPVPGEQHVFGLAMVAEFMRRAGWDAWCEPAATADELAAMLGREWFAVIGFSVSADTNLHALAGVIRAMRHASRNPSIGVLVGGPVFVDRPELVAFVGADATATDARHAALQAENLRDLMAARATMPAAAAAR